MISCCELVKSAHQIILGSFGVILLLVAMLLGYNLKLGKRTAKLEKKNGHEQHQIDELRKEIQKLKSKNG